LTVTAFQLSQAPEHRDAVSPGKKLPVTLGQFVAA
jgi:hypothetical protein